MASVNDPRVDRLIAAVNTLQATQRDQASLIERLREEVATARRDAAQSREDAAMARAETATYQAELTARAKRDDLERLVERVESLEHATSDVGGTTLRYEAMVDQLRERVAKVGRALQNAAAANHVDALHEQVSALDQRVSQVVGDSGHTARTLEQRLDAISEQLDVLRGESTDRVGSLTERVDALRGEFDELAVPAWADLERLSEELDKRVSELAEQVELASDAVSESLDEIDAVPVLVHAVRELRDGQRQLDERVAEWHDPIAGGSGLETRFLELQSRFEQMRGGFETVGTLRERLQRLEADLDRVRAAVSVSP